MPKVDITKELKKEDGTNLAGKDEDKATIRTVATRALSAPLMEGKEPERTTPDEKGTRWALAARLHAEDEPELSTKDIARILSCVNLAYTGSTIYGSMLAELDPSRLQQLSGIKETDLKKVEELEHNADD